MSSKNIKAPYEYMKLKEYKLSDFVPEFSEFRQSDDLSRFDCDFNKIHVKTKSLEHKK